MSRCESYLVIRSSKFPISEQFVSSACFELHINKTSRTKFRIDNTLFESSGNIIFPNFRAVRELAFAINLERGTIGVSQKEVRAGYLNGVGLLDEISHFLVRLYEEKENPGVVKRAYQHLESSIGKEMVEKTLKNFLEKFPSKSIHNNQQSTEEYFNSTTGNRLHKEVALEEMVMLYLANLNPACKNIKELFDDSTLSASSSYSSMIAELERFFINEKPFGPDNQPLIAALKTPILEHPESIEAQLGFLKERWGIILSPKFLERIEGSFEFSKEEEKFIWNTFNPVGGKPNVETFVPEYRKTKQLSPEERMEMLRRGLIKPEDYIYAEPEQFTPDTDWMPNVVLIAKNIYVWLDQMSKKYQREIKRLDQIPDEELDQLARWSFTSLWLIGVWERSSASKRIKQITGNLDAVSSAYSLYDYEIASDLGGEDSFQNLNRRCWQRGIRLAGDMVPNHMGIYSKWVIEHPEYFIQSDHPPYPNYRFTGENLSADPTIELRIEDGYWSRNDAAVVFQRIDRRSGETRYVYHGNDGTSMPWNDTAQLNLLKAEVREAVIQNILHVARKFSVIRFDAAMTLAKKHFQRLWYPMPGTSGVPSRQDHSLSRAEFDAMFPNEFWREVVDRFNAEMPQTLLLAEAFWLMEGYFVRTLGMHRVYNSAFMHMLMKEENEKFRATIKNTLEFNPEILKRYVNFMSNPDEQTAVEQFGKGDKYFGVATLMITLPGLPMFAHGQVEGFNEKYGMEYQRAYYNETPDELLIRRHEYEIFPLTKKRYLFSQVQHFEFYDFLDDRGYVNDNVIAYSNRAGNERAIIFFHNKFAECKGFIKHSLPKATGDGGNVRSVTLSQSLQFQNSEKIFYRFRDRKTTNEYLVSGKDLSDKGIRVELRAFEYAVFTDFQEIYDASGEYVLIAQRLKGKGTGSLDSLLIEMRLKPLHQAIITAFEKFTFVTIERNYEDIFTELGKQFDKKNDPSNVKMDLIPFIEKTKQYFAWKDKEQKRSKTTSNVIKKETFAKNVLSPLFISMYRLVFDLKKYSMNGTVQSNSIDVFQQLRLDDVLSKVIVNNGNDRSTAENTVALLRNLLRLHQSVIESDGDQSTVMETVLNDFETANFLGVNQHNEVWFFNKEQFASLMTWVTIVRCIFKEHSAKAYKKEIDIAHRRLKRLFEASNRSGYQIERLKELLSSPLRIKTSTKKMTKKGNSVSKSTKKKRVDKPSTKVKKRKARNVKRVTKR